MAEMEIERNMALEFDKITEAGSHLAPLAGPGCGGGRGRAGGWAGYGSGTGTLPADRAALHH